MSKPGLQKISMLPVRFSHLRAYGRSAMHGHLARTKEAEQTIPMERGFALHALVFGTRKICGYPGATRRGKDYEAFAAEHADYEILTMAEYEKARGMADAVQQCKLAEPMLKGITEQTILFRWNALDCRATPDVRGDGFITELKTAATAEPTKFTWQALRFHYHAQMRLQQIACNWIPKSIGGIQDCYIVCVESSEPYPVTVFRLEEHALIAGEKLLTLWSERLKNSEASNTYPPYVSCIVPLDIEDDELALEFPADDNLGEQA